MQGQCRRPGRIWYVSDGLIWDDRDADTRPDRTRPLECSSKLLLLNPQVRKAAGVTVRFFHVDRDPTEYRFRLRPHSVESLELAALAGVPRRQPFWIVVESDVPILPQARHEDYSLWQQVPDALCCVSPYPGPLRDETHWLLPDCFEGGMKSWHEQETLTILNPRNRPVDVVLTYRLRKPSPSAQEKITVPPHRVAALKMGQRYNQITGRGNTPPVRLLGDYSIEIEATGPVVPQITRRARWRDFPSIVGSRSVMGVPLTSASEQRPWYYPGGLILDSGVLPRGQGFDLTWMLLFTHRLGGQPAKPARARLTFHDTAGQSTVSQPFAVKPRDTDLQWLHREPYLGQHTQVGQPFAVTVDADQPMLPAMCNAEFEMFSQMCPGAMAAVNLYPGPLTRETTWWLGIGPAGGTDTHEAQWQQMYHLFNPGSKPANVTLRFLGLPGRERTHTVTLGPGAVACVCSDDLPFLPTHSEFAVRADADQPICAQTTVRSFTRGLAATRAMYANMGLPMKLQPAR
jgi:hypothetical protein